MTPVSRDIRTGAYQGQVVTYEVIDGLAIWDGDIILGTPEELSTANVAAPGNTLDSRNKISAISSKESLWPGGIVPYVLDPELTNPYVHDAIRHWNENTVIQLVERTDQPNWVRFIPGRGCLSHVGMVGGEQRVVLSEYCGPGADVHEIGHAVGLWHEHQRNDRDPHIWVSSCPLDPNIPSYVKDGSRALASGPYDYGSVMQYRWIGRLETIPPGIVLGRGGPQLGTTSDTGLSAGDIDGVSRLYGRILTRTTVAANVASLLIEVDGETYTAPHSFDWAPGSIHTIGVASSQKLGFDIIRYLFAKWSDGGGATHDITVSEDPTTITANFARQVLVETDSHGPGTVVVQPSGSEGGRAGRTEHDFSTVVQLTAQPAPGFKFVSWIGDLSGSENLQSLLMDSHKWVRAFFLDEHTFESAKLISGKPFQLLFGPGSARPEGYNGYWIDVPPGATQLAIRLVTTTPNAEVNLYASRDIRPRAVYGANNKGLIGYESQYSSTGAGGDESITITPASSPPLQPGPYFIAVHVRTKGVRVRRTLTADVTVSEEEIAANVPAFGIPASLITTIEGETPPPQSLEIRNSGRGTLDYQITTDQSWLSVRPDQGFSAGKRIPSRLPWTRRIWSRGRSRARSRSPSGNL